MIEELTRISQNEWSFIYDNQQYYVCKNENLEFQLYIYNDIVGGYQKCYSQQIINKLNILLNSNFKINKIDIIINKDIKKILDLFCQNNQINIDKSDKQYLKILLNYGKQITKLNKKQYQWWNTYIVIKQFNLGEKGKYYISYEWAYTTNIDKNIFDLGWEFNQNSISFYKPNEETKITYY